MEEIFASMTPGWFNRAYVYTGSVGQTFRFRCQQTKTETGDPAIKASAYTKLCYELAQDVTERTFPWDEAGVEALKAWFQDRYEAFRAGRGLAEENG